jgi:hypothetical protein
MKPVKVLTIALLLFIAIAHLLRLLFGTEIVISGHVIPVWISAVAVAIFGGAAWLLWRESR